MLTSYILIFGARVCAAASGDMLLEKILEEDSSCGNEDSRHSGYLHNNDKRHLLTNGHQPHHQHQPNSYQQSYQQNSHHQTNHHYPGSVHVTNI